MEKEKEKKERTEVRVSTKRIFICAGIVLIGSVILMSVNDLNPVMSFGVVAVIGIAFVILFLEADLAYFIKTKKSRELKKLIPLYIIFSSAIAIAIGLIMDGIIRFFYMVEYLHRWRFGISGTNWFALCMLCMTMLLYLINNKRRQK